MKIEAIGGGGGAVRGGKETSEWPQEGDWIHGIQSNLQNLRVIRISRVEERKKRYGIGEKKRKEKKGKKKEMELGREGTPHETMRGGRKKGTEFC